MMNCVVLTIGPCWFFVCNRIVASITGAADDYPATDLEASQSI
jgi:hypothetical protein